MAGRPGSPLILPQGRLKHYELAHTGKSNRLFTWKSFCDGPLRSASSDGLPSGCGSSRSKMLATVGATSTFPVGSRGSRAERNPRVMHVDRPEVPMHAAGCTTFCPRHSADDRRVVPRETHDEVEIAFRLVLLAQSGDAGCVDGQAMTLYKTGLRRWMYQRSIN